MSAPYYTRGMTLIDTLIYVAMLVVITSTLVVSFLSVRDALSRYVLFKTITQHSTQIVHQVSNDVRNAESVVLTSSVLGTGSDVVVLQEGATTTTYRRNGSRIEVDQNGTGFLPLSASEVAVTDFTAQYYMNGVSEALAIDMTFSGATAKASTTNTIQTFLVLRGSY